jgi:hypothetical protein
MKSREEIAKELADKQTVSVLDSEIKEVKSILSHFLSDLRNSNLKHEHTYKLSDEVSLDELKKAIGNIPKEFRVATTHTTDTKSNRFLWLHFLVSSLIVALSIGFGIWSYFDHSAKEEAREKRDIEILRQGQEEGTRAVFQHLPKKTQAYMIKKYPDVFGDIEE